MTGATERPRVQLALPRSLADPAGAAEIEVDALTVGEALAELARLRPELAPRLLGRDGRLLSAVAVYLRGQDVRELSGLATPLSSRDRLELVPALSGGDGPAPEPRAFRPEELARYGRHLVLPEVGPEGQRRLAASRVLLVGLGGLGAPAALYLAAAGVGELGLADFADVQTSNLQRQVLYTTADVGRPKVEAAADRLAALNPGVRLVRHPERLDRTNALEVVRRYDVVLDGSDNFPTRYLVNDACVLAGVPDVFGSVYRFEGQVSVFDARHGPCYRCLFPEPPPPDAVPSCADGGVLGVLPGLVGLLQATETLKLLLGVGRPLRGRLLLVDGLDLGFRELALTKAADCPVCSAAPTITELIDYEAFCGVAVGDDDAAAVGAVELRGLLEAASPPLLLDVRSREEYDLGHLPRARSVPLEALAEHLEELGQAGSVVTYCSGGTRSSQASRRLRDVGFRRVRRLSGGFEGWVEAGGPVTTGPGAD